MQKHYYQYSVKYLKLKIPEDFCKEVLKNEVCFEISKIKVHFALRRPNEATKRIINPK